MRWDDVYRRETVWRVTTQCQGLANYDLQIKTEFIQKVWCAGSEEISLNKSISFLSKWFICDRTFGFLETEV